MTFWGRTGAEGTDFECELAVGQRRIRGQNKVLSVFRELRSIRESHGGPPGQTAHNRMNLPLRPIQAKFSLATVEGWLSG
jgi:hypothetical protein